MFSGSLRYIFFEIHHLVAGRPGFDGVGRLEAGTGTLVSGRDMLLLFLECMIPTIDMMSNILPDEKFVKKLPLAPFSVGKIGCKCSAD
jgi:hypothetical protein